MDHDKLQKTLREMGIPDHLTCLLRNLYVGQEATVRMLYGTTDWFKIKKGVRQGCLLTSTLFNLYSERIMRNAGLDELQEGSKLGGKDINNLKNMNDTTLMAEREDALKSLLRRVKEESERTGLRLNIEKKNKKRNKIMASGPITAWQIEEEKVEVVTEFLFLGSQITEDSDCSHEIRKQLPLGRKAMTNLQCVEKQRH